MRSVKKVTTWLLTGVVLSLSSTPALAQQRPNFDVQLAGDAGDYPTGDLFISNIDTVWTAAGAPIPGASILIRNGIIRAIGTDLTAPNGVATIEGAGFHAMPGIVDEHSHIAMSATNEGSAPVVPEVRVLDALDAESYGIYQALSGLSSRPAGVWMPVISC